MLLKTVFSILFCFHSIISPRFLFILPSKSSMFANFPVTFVMVVTFFPTEELQAQPVRTIEGAISNSRQFCNLMQPVLIVANVCGLLPLKNFYSRDINKISFTWKSFEFFYSIFIQFCLFVLFSTSLYRQIKDGIEFNKLRKLSVIS